jgi:3-oxoacyl-[acyl-carrier protein] reductase
VTGAWRGLGRDAAARFYARGASVAVNTRDEARAQQVARALGERAMAVPGDVTDPRAPEQIVGRTLERFGRLDILVNNAALARSTRFEQLDAEEWRQALETNMTAPFLLIKASLPAMKAQRYGRIINISSSAGRTVSTLGGAHYTASPIALDALPDTFATAMNVTGVLAAPALVARYDPA